MTVRAAALLVMLAFPALASITGSSLTGRVTVGDAPAESVTVTLASPVLQQPRTTTTNAQGRYFFDALPPGTYDVTFFRPAHTSLTKRAVLELGRVARADAVLEPNADEDSTTSTATTVSAAETIAVTSHFDDRALDRLPYGRLASVALAPGFAFGDILDGVPGSAVPSEETIEQATVVRAAAPAEWETFGGMVNAFRTRSGRDEFFFTLRDTFTSAQWVSDTTISTPTPRNDDDQNHFLEATAGGRIVPQRLWFFAGAWRGEETFPNASALDGFLAKLDAQLGAAHHLTATHRDTSQNFLITGYDLDTTSLHYTGIAGARFTSEVLAARTSFAVDDFSQDDDFVLARGSYLLGDHLLTAGFANRDDDIGGPARAFFAGDRWSFSRLNVYAGLRHDEAGGTDAWSPRIALTYDLRGNGAHALSASWGEYALATQPANSRRIASLGYAAAIGSSGTARADFIRTTIGSFWQHELQLDARYRLFDRFEAGGSYTLVNRYREPFGGVIFPDQAAHVWLGAELPAGSHEFGVTVLQNFTEVVGRNITSTDAAIRYAIPLSRLGILFAVDATNVFLQSGPPRTARAWVRLRF